MQSLADIMKEFPEPKQPIIKNILRRGEVLNIMAAPKCGKTCLAAQLAFSLTKGLPWLGFETTPGRVLVMDRDHHAPDLVNKFRRVAESMGVSVDDLSKIDVVKNFARPVDSKGIKDFLHRDVDRQHDLIIVDNVYEIMPEDFDDDSNLSRSELYNGINAWAEAANAAIVLINNGRHRPEKLRESIPGAYSESRISDSYLVFLKTSDDDFAVHSTARTWPSTDPFTVHFDFPLWKLNETKLRNRNNEPIL